MGEEEEDKEGEGRRGQNRYFCVVSTCITRSCSMDPHSDGTSPRKSLLIHLFPDVYAIIVTKSSKDLRWLPRKRLIKIYLVNLLYFFFFQAFRNLCCANTRCKYF